MIRLGQINADRVKVVTSELREEAVREGIGILALQEPYSDFAHRIAGWGVGARVVLGAAQGERPWAAIVILDPRVDVMKLGGMSSAHWVVAEIQAPRYESFYLVSMYCQPSLPLDGFVTALGRISRALAGRRVVYCLDANTKNPTWGGSIEDERGTQMEGCIVGAGLLIWNDPVQQSTYET